VVGILVRVHLVALGTWPTVLRVKHILAAELRVQEIIRLCAANQLVLELRETLLRHQLIGEQLYDFAVGHLLVIVWVHHSKQSIDIMLSILFILNDYLHAIDEVSKLVLVYDAVAVSINLLEEQVEFI
jgi:hypothetical protein